MVDLLDKKRKEKIDVIVKQQEELAEQERQEKRILQKQETVKIRTLQRMATERGMSMKDLEAEMGSKKSAGGGDGDDVSSIGDPVASVHEGMKEDDHSAPGSHQPIQHQISNPSLQSQSQQRGRLTSQDSKGLSSLQGGGGIMSHRSYNSRSPSPSAEPRFSHSCELTEMPLVHDVSGDSVILVLGDPECGLEAAASDPAPRYSKEILETANNLVNFSLYCGYNNLRMDQIPEDLTHEVFSHDESYMNEDDHWLTASFYLNVTKEHIDGIREATQKIFDPILHSLDSTPLNSLKLIYEAMSTKNHETRQPVSLPSSLHPSLFMLPPPLRTSHTLHKLGSLIMVCEGSMRSGSLDN
jgi:hypothetical protein